MKIDEIQVPAPGRQLQVWDPTQVLALIDKHCAKYIIEVQLAQKWLYRGLRDADYPAFVGNSMQYRKPKDSDPYYSQQFDYMLGLLGIQALRQNSIFTTSRAQMTKFFGQTYVIFPIDGAHVFSYTSEPDIVLDSREALRWANLHKIDEFKDFLRDLEQSHPDDAVRLAAELTVKATDEQVFRTLPNLSHSMLKGHVPEKFWDWKTYLDLDKFVENYKPTDRNLHVALTKTYEVLIHGGYVALKLSVYEPMIGMRWGVPVRAPI
jgi:hypothetical protein